MAPQQDQKPFRKRYKKVDVFLAATLRTENVTLQENDREKVQDQTDKDIILVVDRIHRRDPIIIIIIKPMPLSLLRPKKPQPTTPKTNPQQTKSLLCANASKKKIPATPSTSPTSNTKSLPNTLGTPLAPKDFGLA
ncbi:hypothetical protein KCU65_g9117, partial [Aureobasidium melanogenum]